MAIGIAWGVVVLVGFGFLLEYKTRPGTQAAPPSRWPQASAIERAANTATLILFAHPKCACTRASLSELARTMSRLAHKPPAIVAFVLPRGVGRDWQHTDLWTSASRIDGVRVFADVDGRESARFHVETSGTTLVYDAAGRLAFSGGLTSSRGHEGPSFGQERVLALLSGAAPDRRDSPVFGCPVRESRPEETPR